MSEENSGPEINATRSQLADLTRRLFLYEIVQLCAKEAEFVKCFDRLTSSNLSQNGTGLELMIDQATGRQDNEVKKFIDFVDDIILQRLPPLVIAEMCAISDGMNRKNSTAPQCI